MKGFLRKLFRRAPSNENVQPRFDRTPDLPESFGFKVSWFAVKTADPAAVLDALALGEAVPCNWASGVEAAYERPPGDGRWAFVTPPVDGWVLAVSSFWPYPAGETSDYIGAKFDAVFARLMARFDDVQFFGSHRVADFVTWARARNGEPKRLFAYGDGEVAMNFGSQTPEEAKLGLVDLTGLSPHDAVDTIFRLAEEEDEKETGRRVFPEEGDVVALAGLCSIDPSRLAEQDHPPGVGWAVRLPDDLRQ